jgi:hypothetical protein
MIYVTCSLGYSEVGLCAVWCMLHAHFHPFSDAITQYMAATTTSTPPATNHCHHQSLRYGATSDEINASLTIDNQLSADSKRHEQFMYYLRWYISGLRASGKRSSMMASQAYRVLDQIDAKHAYDSLRNGNGSG